MRSQDPKGSKKRYFRSPTRIFSSQGAWFFSTREGDQGPFKTRQTAEREVKRYLKDRADLKRFQTDRENGVKPLAAMGIITMVERVNNAQVLEFDSDLLL